MAKQLKKIFERSTDEIVQGFTVQSWHVSQSVDALTGAEDYDITISGSLTVTGSVYLDGIEDADGSDVYSIVINQNSGQIFTTASSYGPIPPSPPGQNGSSGSSGTSGNDGSSGTSGTGIDGSSGTSGEDGSSGTSGATGDPGTSGTSGTGGAGGGGSSGTSGNNGANGALIFPYQYKSTLPPPTGFFRFGNILNQDASTFVVINNTDGTGNDISGFLDTLDNYGGDVKAILKVEELNDPTHFILFEIGSYTTSTNYRTINATNIVQGANFSNDDDILVSFSLVGPEGTSGTSGAGGSGSGGTAGSSGTSGNDGSSGTSGETGSSGTSGNDGSSGTSGTTGTSGNGTDGTSGTTGTSGNGTDGTSGTGGAGSSGTSGTTGTSGNGTAGTSGTGGAGSSGTSGTTGTSGNGTAGTSGTDGTSGIGIPAGGTSGQVLAKIDSTDYNTEWVNGGGSQLVFTTASVANNNVSLPTTREIKADSVNDTLNFDFLYLVSGSTDTSNDTISVSSLPEPQIYTRKNSESGLGGAQTVTTGNTDVITWEDLGPDYRDNVSWWAVNADSNLAYNTLNPRYIEVLQPGLYEIDLQLGMEGNNSVARARVDILSADSAFNPFGQIARGTYDVGSGSGGINFARPIRLSATWYISQQDIQNSQSYIIITVLCSGAGSSVIVGGDSNAYEGSSWFKVKKLTDSGLAT